jgi:hypothetical protein
MDLITFFKTLTVTRVCIITFVSECYRGDDSSIGGDGYDINTTKYLGRLDFAKTRKASPTSRP